MYRYPSEAPADELRNGLLLFVCGPLGIPTLSTPDALPCLALVPLLPHAARPAIASTPASATARRRWARMVPPSVGCTPSRGVGDVPYWRGMGAGTVRAAARSSRARQARSG